MFKLINILMLTALMYIFSFNEIYEPITKIIKTTIIENSDISAKYSLIEKEIINLLSSNHDQLTTIINRDVSLSKDYIPEDLTTPNINLVGYTDEPRSKVRKVMENDLTNMFTDANSSGLNLFLLCGYRSYSEQEYLYNEELKNTNEDYTDLVAQPGHSEHQLGLAIDVTIPDLSFFLDESFEESDSFLWLKDNSHKYGFILRYPKGKENITGYSYEPWHFRYVGNKIISTYCYENDLTLEEVFIKLNIK